MCSRSPSKGKCSESSTVYRIRCNRSPCNDEESLEVPTYVGETSHTPYTRGAQHLCQYRARKDGSFMHKHMMEEHEGVMGGEGGIFDFKMEALNRFRDPLTRILEEAVRIQEIDGDPRVKMMNSKMEHYGPQYVRPEFTKGPADRW